MENITSIQPEVVDLLPKELKLLNKLGDFSISKNEGYERNIEKLETCLHLSISLLQRKAIPAHRLRYFDDPKHNLSNPKRSRLDTFKENLSSGEEIMKHPHFLKYLKYFIYGPELPSSLILELGKIKEEVFYDEEFFNRAKPIVRAYCKSSGLNKASLAEEFYKLCLELEIESGYREPIRNYVMRVK